MNFDVEILLLYFVGDVDSLSLGWLVVDIKYKTILVHCWVHIWFFIGNINICRSDQNERILEKGYFISSGHLTSDSSHISTLPKYIVIDVGESICHVKSIKTAAIVYRSKWIVRSIHLFTSVMLWLIRSVSAIKWFIRSYLFFTAVVLKRVPEQSFEDSFLLMLLRWKFLSIKVLFRGFSIEKLLSCERFVWL